MCYSNYRVLYIVWLKPRKHNEQTSDYGHRLIIYREKF